MERTAKYDRIVVLTGAGISADSGVSTFRDPDGIWARHDIDEVATPEAFARNPRRVHEFYNDRRRGLAGVETNAGHQALADLEQHHPGDVLIVTQNVDDLHERAGATNLIHMHGELAKVRCAATYDVFDWSGDLSLETICPDCGAAGTLRPDIVWFGEMPMHMDRIQSALQACDLFLSIGTSGNVYPAAGFVAEVRSGGRAYTAELNLEPSEGHSLFAETVYGRAAEIVPEYVARLLAS